MDRLRAKYAEPPLVSAGDLDLAGTEEASDLEEDIALMHEELERLPVAEREVLVLFYLHYYLLIRIPYGRGQNRWRLQYAAELENKIRSVSTELATL